MQLNLTIIYCFEEQIQLILLLIQVITYFLLF